MTSFKFGLLKAPEHWWQIKVTFVETHYIIPILNISKNPKNFINPTSNLISKDCCSDWLMTKNQKRRGIDSLSFIFSQIRHFYPSWRILPIRKSVCLEKYSIIFRTIFGDSFGSDVEPYFSCESHITNRIQVHSVLKHHNPSASWRHSCHELNLVFFSRLLSWKSCGRIDMVEIEFHLGLL